MLEELYDNGHLSVVKMKALDSPAQLLLHVGRPLRTRLDLVKPNLNQKMFNQQHQQGSKGESCTGKSQSTARTTIEKEQTALERSTLWKMLCIPKGGPSEPRMQV